MKQKINVRQKLALRLGTTLEYIAAGTALAGVVVGILFTFNFLGNNKDATANNSSSNIIMLSPEDGVNGNEPREAQPSLSVTSVNDSLYIEFTTDDTEPMQDAVLRLRDMDGKENTEKSSQTKIMTLFSPKNMNRTTYRFAIPTKGFPEQIRIEVRTNLSLKKNHTAEESTQAWSAKFDFNLRSSEVLMLHSGFQAKKGK